MKRLLFLLLLCLSLCGCAAHEGDPSREPAEVPAETEETLPPPSYYEAGHRLEAETAGAITVFPLPHMAPTGLFRVGDRLILTGEAEGGTLLQSLSGEALTLSGTLQLPSALSPEEGFFQCFPDRLVLYDPMTLELLVLEENLQVLQRIPVPEDLMGSPLLSREGDALYYCTREAIRVLETGSGISRLLKEIACPYQSAAALLKGDTLLQCTILEENGEERTLILSTENGRTVFDQPGKLDLSLSAEGRFFARLSANPPVFGEESGGMQMLRPGCAGSFFAFLPQSQGALSVSPSPEGVALDYYDLTSGKRTAGVTLSGISLPTAALEDAEGCLWFLTREGDVPLLCRWDTAGSPSGEDTIYTSPFSPSPEQSDDAMATCRQYAAGLSEKYGLEILPEGAYTTLPEGCTAEYEQDPRLLTDRLTALDALLASLPRELPETISGRYSGLRIIPVRSLQAAEGTGFPEKPASLFFWEGTTACMVLSAEQESLGFYSALFGLADTVIHTRSAAFDQWETLNPLQFSYTGSHAAPVPESYLAYLDPERRAFADRSSMVSPKEERTRLFAYAMMPGNGELFSSLTMQSKLSVLCKGLREAFGLKNTRDLPWEQYLQP